MALAADPSSLSSVVLLTGFGPFPGMPENISARLVRTVSQRARSEIRPHRFHASILPTEWHAAPQRVAALIARLRPKVALHFGVAKDAHGFRIETQGRNACRMTVDAVGRMPSAEHLIADAPPAYACELPFEKIVNRLTELRLPVATSDDAGGYLCNSVLYHSLHTGPQSEAPLRAGFVHIPSALVEPGLSFEQAVMGSLEIIRIALDDGRSPAG